MKAVVPVPAATGTTAWRQSRERSLAAATLSANDSETARDLHIWSRRLTGFIKDKRRLFRNCSSRRKGTRK